MKRYLALLITFVLVGCEDKMKICEITKVSGMNSPSARLSVYGGQAGDDFDAGVLGAPGQQRENMAAAEAVAAGPGFEA